MINAKRIDDKAVEYAIESISVAYKYYSYIIHLIFKYATPCPHLSDIHQSHSINLSAAQVVGLLHELHVLNHSALPVVLQLVLNTLLPHEAPPVQLALTHRVDLPAPVVYCSHHMVQVLVRNVRLTALKLHRALLCHMLLLHFDVLLLLDDFQLACVFVEDELFSGEDYSFVGLDGLTAEDCLGEFEGVGCWLISFDFFLEGEEVLVFGILIELVHGGGCECLLFLFFVLLAVDGFF